MFIQLIVSGILIGGVYALLIIGLSLMLGVSKFTNFAYGDFVVIGSYLAFSCYQAFKLSPYFSLPLVFLGAVVIGLIIFLVARLTIGRSAENQMLVTLGLSMMIQNILLMFFKSDYKVIPATFNASVGIGNIFISTEQLFTFLIALIVTGLLLLFIKYTNVGRAMRAVGEDRIASKAMGINVHKIDLIVFCMGTALAALSGALLMTMYPTNPTIGSEYNLIAWVIVVLGGIGRLEGALVAALMIGIIQTLTGFYLGADLRELVYYVVFIIVLIFRPEGLFDGFTLGKVKK